MKAIPFTIRDREVARESDPWRSRGSARGEAVRIGSVMRRKE